jgi:hypothetical protein
MMGCIWFRGSLVVLAVIAERVRGTTRFELRLNGFDREFDGLRDDGIAVSWYIICVNR